jgi:hypothetical protein
VTTIERWTTMPTPEPQPEEVEHRHRDDEATYEAGRRKAASPTFVSMLRRRIGDVLNKPPRYPIDREALRRSDTRED